MNDGSTYYFVSLPLPYLIPLEAEEEMLSLANSESSFAHRTWDFRSWESLLSSTDATLRLTVSAIQSNSARICLLLEMMTES